MYENFFRQNKKFVIVCILFILAYIITAAFTYRGLFFDIPGTFLYILPKEERGLLWIWSDYKSVNMFSNMLLALPYNLIYPVFQNNLMQKLGLYTFSCYFMTFAALLFNVYLAKRTKRYDVAVLTFAFYILFYIPSSVWCIRDISFAVMMQMALLQYFLTKETLERKDYFIIAFLSVYLFESFENIIFVGLIFFLASLFYFFRHKENAKKKLFIGITGLLAAIYGAVNFVIFNLVEKGYFSFESIYTDFYFETMNAFKHSLEGAVLISLFAVVTILVVSVFRLKLNKDYVPLTILLVFVLLACIYIQNGFVPDVPGEKSSYVFAEMIVFPLFALKILFDFFNVKFNDNFYNNLILITCCTGIIACLWQLNSCRFSFEYASNIREKLENNTGTVFFTKEEKKLPFMAYDSCFGTLQRSVILSKDYEVKTILVPYETDKDIDSVCMANTSYKESDGSVTLQSNYMKIKNRYHDLTGIIPYIKKIEEKL